MLKYAAVGVVSEDGEETITHLNYNALLWHEAKAIQAPREVIKQQQLQIDEQEQRLAWF